MELTGESKESIYSAISFLSFNVSSLPHCILGFSFEKTWGGNVPRKMKKE